MDYKEAKSYIRHVFKNMNISDEMKEALDLADKAIDKQIGKTPNQKMRIIRDFVYAGEKDDKVKIKKDIVFFCECGKRLFRSRDESCPECGQKIYWGDDE